MTKDHNTLQTRLDAATRKAGDNAIRLPEEPRRIPVTPLLRLRC